MNDSVIAMLPVIVVICFVIVVDDSGRGFLPRLGFRVWRGLLGCPIFPPLCGVGPQSHRMRRGFRTSGGCVLPLRFPTFWRIRSVLGVIAKMRGGFVVG